jgi:hypothetical protein
MKLPKKLRIRQLAEAIPCTRRHVYDMRREGLVATTRDGPRNVYLTPQQWQDFWDRLEADRRRLGKPHLRFPVTKAGEAGESAQAA